MASKKRVKEVYCHKTSNGRYTIDLVDASNCFLKNQATDLSEKERDSFLKKLLKGENTKLTPSAFGVEIYHRKPEQRNLHKNPSSIFEAYVKNLQNQGLTENSHYRHKVANLLRNVSDLLDYEDHMEPVVEPPEEGCSCSSDSIVPGPAVEADVPLSLLGNIQETLDVTIDFDNSTFWFQGEKWQLTKDGYEQENLPKMKRPGTSPKVEGSMQYMINLLGVNAEVAYEDKNPRSFKFLHNGDLYRISHIYTKDKSI